ncbi:MAG: hypothetical protein AB1767_07465 [Bacillota bacterium]
MSELIFFLVPPLGVFWLARPLIDLFTRQESVKTNYRGILITTALGPALLLGFLIAAAVNLWQGSEPVTWLALTTVLIGAAFFGLWDDLMEDQITGFKGHFREGLQGRLSAGLLKVATAVLIAFIFTALLEASPGQRALAFFLLLLSTNGLNLLDRRPGRAIKAFFLFGLLIVLLALQPERAARLLLPLLSLTLAVAPFDFNAHGMLGDSGSNLLGAALGGAAVLSLSVPLQLTLLLFWVVLNILAEFISISDLIERNNLLRRLDYLGRTGEKMPCRQGLPHTGGERRRILIDDPD